MGEEDLQAPRSNMVRATAVIIGEEGYNKSDLLKEVVLFLDPDAVLALETAGSAAMDAITNGISPAIVGGVSDAPSIINYFWQRLWPAARFSFSLQTVYGTEGLQPDSLPTVVVTPVELRTRWQSHVPSGQYIDLSEICLLYTSPSPRD